jgi:hypothetical protein
MQIATFQHISNHLPTRVEVIEESWGCRLSALKSVAYEKHLF